MKTTYTLLEYTRRWTYYALRYFWLTKLVPSRLRIIFRSGPLGMDCCVHQTVSRAGDSFETKEKQDEVQDQCLPQQAVLSSQQYCGQY